MVNRHTKILNIVSHQRKADQNYNEAAPHTGQNGHHCNVYKQQMLERVWRKGSPHTSSGNANSHSHQVNSKEAPQKPELHMIQQFHSWKHIWRKLTQKDTCIPKLIAAPSTIAKTWKHSKSPPTDEWTKMWKHTHTHTHTQDATQP